MTYNTIGYLIYIPVTIFITVYVGKQCHTHGLIYVKSAFTNNDIANSVNNLLLIGYYLVNIGYAVTRITNWEFITSAHVLISEVSSQLSLIILVLALLHYANIAGLSLLRKYNNQIIN